MPGRLAVPQTTPVVGALAPLCLTRQAGQAGSPAWAGSAAGPRSSRQRPALSSFDATRRSSTVSSGGAVRLDLPLTVR